MRGCSCGTSAGLTHSRVSHRAALIVLHLVCRVLQEDHLLPLCPRASAPSRDMLRED